LLGVSFGDVSVGNVKLVNTSVAIQGDPNSLVNYPVGVSLIGIAATTGVRGGTNDRGLVVAEKPGALFALGMTLSNLFFGFTTNPSDNIAGSCGGGQYLYLKSTPVCVTTNYSGPAANGTINGQVSVPLKQGLYVQLTKWDLISHVHVGYTASTVQEFRRNAQVLHKEYQMAPIWAHALDQFRRFPGVTGNNGPILNNDFEMTDNSWPMDGDGSASMTPVQKQYIGIIEKPTRIFIPCRDAGEVYVLVNGDFSGHEIGAGFWDLETKTWTATTLYERSYYASSFYGFTAGEPTISTSGVPGGGAGSGGEYDGWSDGGVGFGLVAPGISAGTSENPGNPGTAIAQILAGYTNNPFIRVWGY